MKTKLFIDSDVLIDVLAERHPFYSDSARILSLSELGQVLCYTTPVVISNIFYILRKLSTKSQALNGIRKIRMIVNIIPVTQAHIDKAISANFQDLEDAIQYYASLDASIDYIITRNTLHFKRLQIPAFTPQDFLMNTSVDQTPNPASKINYK
jgi:predicted nucleic acid-binding protein